MISSATTGHPCWPQHRDASASPVPVPLRGLSDPRQL